MIKTAEIVLAFFRTVSRFAVTPLIYLLIPVKMFAWRTSHKWLKRIVLEITALVDFLSIFAVVQNHAVLAHWRAYGGNFIFGKSIMVVAHEKAETEIARPTLRGNRFMGVDIVSNDPGVFVTNAGPINTGQPVRGHTRDYIETTIMTDRIRGLGPGGVKEMCLPILQEWKDDPDMATMWTVRSTVTRLFIRILAGQTLDYDLARKVTIAYTRRFAEFSLFGGYLPFVLGFLGTRRSIRRDAFIPLRRLGIDNVIIDMTLFAAMFSIGTIVCKCVEFASRYDVDYASLSPKERRGFVIEALRLYPTVTTVHRIVESEEKIEIRGETITAEPGDEITYPFACINRDPKVFSNPEAFRLDRSETELDRMLSWSAGDHACPAKEMSIQVTTIMLESLAERHDLRTLHIFSPEF